MQQQHTEPVWVPSAEYLERIRQYEREQEIKAAIHYVKYKNNARYRKKVDAERKRREQLEPNDS
jgi:hypothetical protein